MLRKLTYAGAAVALLVASQAVQAAHFELLPTYDTYVSNDGTEGPTTSHETGSGMHVRDVAGRRRVGYLTYDLSEAKTQGVFFTNVSFSNYGHDTGQINVYGVIESQEALVGGALTWSTAPGVMNDPMPAIDAAVELDPADLTGVLLTFSAPARGTRAATETSEALAAFLNSDTNGFVAFLFAPVAGGNAIVRTVEMGADGGTRLVFDIGGRAAAARSPDPEDEATDIYRETDLSWTPGGFAGAHDVYLGTVFADVNDASRSEPRGVLVSQGQDANTYDPGRLELGRTYYWRIDEVNATPDATIFKGQVWSFSVEPLAYAIANISVTTNATSDAGLGPENTINGSGLNDMDQHSIQETDMWLASPGGEEPIWIQYEFDRVYQLHELWVWNYNVLFEAVLGYGLRLVTIDYSADGADWTTFGDVEFAKATAKPDYAHNTTLNLNGAAARFVRLTVKSGWGVLGYYGLSEVRFLHIPAFARQPQPADGQTDVAPDVTLRWRAGRSADVHDVYLGTDPQTLSRIDTVAQDNIAPEGLEFGTAYSWRVDEVNEAETVASWQGDFWSFVTKEYETVDGFESYTDDIDAGMAIFDTWLDGWVNNTGSTVGYLSAPFAERTIVHSGSQSMPLAYNNSESPWYSEAGRAFDAPQDWTAHGADSLRLYFRGDATNSPQNLYIMLEDSAGRSAIVSYGDPDAILATEWVAWEIRLTEFVGVNASRVETITLGVGSRTSPAAGGDGIVYIDDIGFGKPVGGE
ncbi:MAG TPA: discoidin domain-containing protein [Sedimentisphaerales bacterium]|nr:discoidin domain-containing protein [Sedimentisphaerales bacterium]HRS09731.1 discoidin domain-containing protein [Sedimentisphaerales bacterium]HRV46619.1 discoidin domain-containing protein [Sedimentisphaerales bacterium]